MPPDVGFARNRLPVDRLLGRRVLDRDGQSAGRIQELRVDVRDAWRVTTYVLGVGGLLERLHIGLTLLLGGRVRAKVVRADQVDLSDPERPRLTCGRDELPSA